jgi:hypothetical protein
MADRPVAGWAGRRSGGGLRADAGAQQGGAALGHRRDREARVDAHVGADRGSVGHVETGVAEHLVVGVGRPRLMAPAGVPRFP